MSESYENVPEPIAEQIKEEPPTDHVEMTTSGDKSDKAVRRPGKRGRRPAKIDSKAKLERSRQSARECRARKKLRYQYLEEMVSSREKAIFALRDELESYQRQSKDLDEGRIPEANAMNTAQQ